MSFVLAGATREDCHAAVQTFSKVMLEKLEKNLHKGGWGDCSYAYLRTRLKEEFDELMDAFIALHAARQNDRPTDELERNVREEAADLANIAMFFAEHAGLRPARHLIPHGCYCELEPDMKPDECVIDQGRPQDCVHADPLRPGCHMTKWDCPHWRPVGEQGESL